MRRRFTVCFLLIALLFRSAAVHASEPAEMTVRLAVQPMAAPKPALKYVFLPEVSEMTPGNAAQWYLRCFAEQRQFFFSKEGGDERKRLLTKPLGEIEVEKYAQYGGNALRQADWAARLNTVDWQVLSRIQTEGAELSQPELGPLHILATALQARFRTELAAKRYDDAVRTVKTLFGFARHLGESPTEAANRLGLTIADLTVDALEEMLQQPDCPNLYWALTDLRCPLVEIRNGFQGTGTMVANELKPLREDTVMTDEQLEKVVSRLSGIIGYAREQAGHAPRSFRGLLAARAKNADTLAAVRKRLLDAGLAEGLVPNFPANQVLLLDAKRDYETRRDDSLKLLSLTPWQIDTLTDTGRNSGADGLMADLIPTVLKTRLTQARFEARVALLRHVEALRMYAAAHEGRWPAKLADLPVPVPDDPFTGKPFGYQVEGATAHLHGTPPKAEEKNPAYRIHLVVTVKK
jgi:hypothetical protein